jgi:hypothetical protein
MWNVKATSLATGATGTVSETLRKYQSNIAGKHEIRELQKTAILITARILVLPKAGTNIQNGQLHYMNLQTVTPVQLQHCSPLKHGWFQVYKCKYLEQR